MVGFRKIFKAQDARKAALVALKEAQEARKAALVALKEAQEARKARKAALVSRKAAQEARKSGRRGLKRLEQLPDVPTHTPGSLASEESLNTFLDKCFEDEDFLRHLEEGLEKDPVEVEVDL